MGEWNPYRLNDFEWEVLEVYLKVLIHPLDEYGVDFYWIDDDGKKDLKRLWMLNHYHFMDMKKDYKRRSMVVTRNPGVAAHRYPILYSGKTIVGWDTLSLIPLHNSSATNVGVSFWSHDIGGYYKGEEDNELYTRYVQLGVFSPILKFGSDGGMYYKREPWRWSIKTNTIVSDYLGLRHNLIPYFYTESYKYHKYGMPLISPIYYKYPEIASFSYDFGLINAKREQEYTCKKIPTVSCKYIFSASYLVGALRCYI